VAADATDRRGLIRLALTGAMRATAALSPNVGRAAKLINSDGTAPAESNLSLDLPTRTVTLDEMLATASGFGLASRSKAIVSAARTSGRFAEFSEMPTGNKSNTQGVRQGHTWPTRHGHPLSLLALVDVKVLAPSDVPRPSTNKLAFFFNEGGATGSPNDGNKAQLLNLDEADCFGLFASGKSGSDPLQILSEVSRELVLPRAWSSRLSSLNLSDAEAMSWESLREWLADAQAARPSQPLPTQDHVVHRILGYPDYTGGDMQLICELCSQGYDVSPGSAAIHPQASKVEEASDRWELLAQFSADETLGWRWRSGTKRLYYWIDRDALAIGDFANVWVIAR